jgi:hypothetical protein
MHGVLKNRCFGALLPLAACAVFLIFLPLIADEPKPFDASPASRNLTPLQAALIKEAVEGKQYLYPSFLQREEDLFTSNSFFALARRPKQSFETLDLFDFDGKNRCSVDLDDNFCGASLSDVSWFVINRSIWKKDGVRQCIVYDQACNTMAQVQFFGASMIISPSGDFGTLSGPNPVTGAGDFQIFSFRKNSKVNATPLQNAVFLGARFCRDNGVVTLWKEQSDSFACIKIAKYDASSGVMLKTVIAMSEKARPLACPPIELLQFEESRGHELFGFFAIDDRYCLTAQQDVPNTTVVFDLDLRVKCFSSDRIHRTLKLVDDNLVAVGTWFDAKMFSKEGEGAPQADEKIELFDFVHEKAIGETEGTASPLVCAVNLGEEIHLVFQVSTLSLAFNRSTQKFNRIWGESAGGAPMASRGKKTLRYSFSTKKFILP